MAASLPNTSQFQGSHPACITLNLHFKQGSIMNEEPKRNPAAGAALGALSAARNKKIMTVAGGY
jgi:hypothetical protein